MKSDEAAGEVDVLLTEVLEHLPMEEASTFLKEIVTNVPFQTLFVTTPNAAFNAFYLLDGFRHSDHKWEQNREDFQRWLRSLVNEEDHELTFFGIGDRVDGVQPTSGAILKRKEHVL
jgi:small RNA 2'-O-methyltransferase